MIKIQVSIIILLLAVLSGCNFIANADIIGNNDTTQDEKQSDNLTIRVIDINGFSKSSSHTAVFTIEVYPKEFVKDTQYRLDVIIDNNPIAYQQLRFGINSSPVVDVFLEVSHPILKDMYIEIEKVFRGPGFSYKEFYAGNVGLKNCTDIDIDKFARKYIKVIIRKVE